MDATGFLAFHFGSQPISENTVLKRLYPDSSLLASGLATFQRQETIFVSLNLLLLGVLLCAHSVFGKYWGNPSGALVAVLLTGFFLNALELVWLQFRSRPLTIGVAAVVTWGSIALSLTLAFFLSVLSNTDDSPYYVLMLVPILQALSGSRSPR